jgi:hypothetical protein
MGTAQIITKNADTIEVIMVNFKAKSISSEKRALINPCGVGIRNKLPIVMKNKNVKNRVMEMKINSSLDLMLSLKILISDYI